jgi:hypothetical protein
MHMLIEKYVLKLVRFPVKETHQAATCIFRGTIYSTPSLSLTSFQIKHIFPHSTLSGLTHSPLNTFASKFVVLKQLSGANEQWSVR